MLKFDKSTSEEIVLEKAEQYFKLGKYWDYVNYINLRFDECSPKTKSQLLCMLGKIYCSWKSYDRATLALRFSIKFEKENSEALLWLSKAYYALNSKFSFKETFSELGMVDEEKVFEDIKLVEYYNEISQFEFERSIRLVDDQFKENLLLDKSNEFLATGKIDEAIECLESLLEQYPKNMEAYEQLTMLYIAMFDDEKLTDLCKRKLDNYPNDIKAISMYLYLKKDDSSFDYLPYYTRLLSQKIKNMDDLKSVVEVLDFYHDYQLALTLMENFAKEYDCFFNHDILMMKVVANLKLNRDQNAKQLFNILNMAYGMIGESVVCKNFFACKAEQLKIANVYYIPDEMHTIAMERKQDLDDKIKSGDQASFYDFWQVYELIVLTCDEDDILSFLDKYKNEFTLKYPSKIAAILCLREQLTDIIKTGIIAALIACGVRKFEFVKVCSVEPAEFEDIDELEDFPTCYLEAYIYAFAYCALHTIAFADAIKESTLELIETMEKSKRNFRDSVALAGAIICNSYLVVGGDITAEVAKLIDCSTNRLKRYLSIIRKEGEYFELEDDDMFEMLIKKIANRFEDTDEV